MRAARSRAHLDRGLQPGRRRSAVVVVGGCRRATGRAEQCQAQACHCCSQRGPLTGRPGPHRRGPATLSTAHAPNSQVGQAAQREPRDRVDPEERAAAAEVAERPRRVARAGPVRRLAVAELEAEAPVVRLLAAEARERRRRGPGNCTVVASASVSGDDQRRREQLAPEREQVVERAVHARARPARRSAPPSPSGSSTAARSTSANDIPARSASAGRARRSRSRSRSAARPAARSARRPRTAAPRRARAGAGRSSRAARPARRGRRPLLRRDEHASAVTSFVTDAQRYARAGVAVRRRRRPPPSRRPTATCSAGQPSTLAAPPLRGY